MAERVVCNSCVRPDILYVEASMIHERKLDGNIAKDREIHGEINVWTTVQR